MKPNGYLQSESSECGLACLATVASAHGLGLDLSDLRRRFSISLKGANLRQLVTYAGSLGFSSRPLSLEVEEISQLSTPCILHWDLNHFVVLRGVFRNNIKIFDPAIGERTVSVTEFSRHFTGIALEISPNADFRPAEKKSQRISIQNLTGNVRGLKQALFQIFAVAAVLELLAIAAPLLSQVIVDDVVSSGDRDLLTVLALGFSLVLIIQAAIGLSRSWMVISLGQNMAFQWLGNVFAHLIRLPTSFFEKRNLGDVTSRFGAVSAIQNTLTNTAIEALLDGIMAVATLALMLLYSPPLAGIVILAVVIYAATRWATYGALRSAAAERLVMAAKENSHFLETLRAMTPLKLFGREEERRTRWQNLVVEVQNRELRTAKLNMAFTTINSFVFGLENILVLSVGAKLILDGQTSGNVVFTVGMLFAFISYKLQFTGRVSSLINFAVELKMLSLHAERLSDIVLEPPERDEVPVSDLSHLQPSIELRNVSFRYGEGDPWVLKNVNFRIDAGENIALTGPSGAGKTTLMKIALGLLSPTEGEVLFGGVPVQQLGLSNFRKQIGTVMQEDVLLTGSLSDNIAFFDLQPDSERVIACARLAQFHDDVARMPMGYQTLVGELGSGLSGGQKQRLLLARALYKQPRVLALDEATSHLDVQNERAVTAALSHLKLTRLIIAHRPETIAGAQRVVQVRDLQVHPLARVVTTA